MQCRGAGAPTTSVTKQPSNYEIKEAHCVCSYRNTPFNTLIKWKTVFLIPFFPDQILFPEEQQSSDLICLITYSIFIPLCCYHPCAIFKKSVLKFLSPFTCIIFASEWYGLSLHSKLTCGTGDKDLSAERLQLTGISIFISTAVGSGSF